MWFHAINSHGELLVLSSKGSFALESIGWSSIENIIHSVENAFTLPSLRHLPKECSVLYKTENRHLPEHEMHVAEKKLPPRCCSFPLSLSLRQLSS